MILHNLHIAQPLHKKSLNGLSQNDNINILNHIYLMHLEKQYGAVCERDYSSEL